MSRAPRAGRTTRRLLPLLLAMVVLIVASGLSDPRTSPAKDSRISMVSASTSAQGARWVVLDAPNGSATAGDPVDLYVEVSPFNCSGADTPNRTVTEIAVHFGDGYTFEAFHWPKSDTLGCARPPWNTIVPVFYAYRDAGTYNITASVTWKDGVERNTTPLTITVNVRTDLTSWLAAWLVGSGLVMLVSLSACYFLRERLPESPSLPPRQV